MLNGNLGTSSRRHFLASGVMGLGGVALTWLLHQDGVLANPMALKPTATHYDLLPKAPQHTPKATAMISLWMQGGPSHIDLFDPKPELERLDGQPFPGEIKYDNAAQASSKVLASPWKFAQHGASARVGDVMQREFVAVSPRDMLESAFTKLQECNCHTLPVVDDGRLLGLMTADNLAEVLMIQESLREANRRRAASHPVGQSPNAASLPSTRSI